MSDWSRRRALHPLAVTTATAVAGCSGRRGFETESQPALRGKPVTEYAVRKVHDTAGEPLFWTASADGGSDTERSRRTSEYLTSSEDVESVTFASNTDAAAAALQTARSLDPPLLAGLLAMPARGALREERHVFERSDGTLDEHDVVRLTASFGLAKHLARSVPEVHRRLRSELSASTG